MKQSLTTVKSVVSVVQVVDEHLSANTDGNIVPSESEYVPVHAVADGSVKHVFLFTISASFRLQDISPLKHSLTTSRSEVIVLQVVESHLAATTVGKVELPP